MHPLLTPRLLAAVNEVRAAAEEAGMLAGQVGIHAPTLAVGTRRLVEHYDAVDAWTRYLYLDGRGERAPDHCGVLCIMGRDPDQTPEAP